MPNVARLAARRPQRSEPLFLFDARRPIRAANTDMIDQVITHADLCARLAGGRLKLQVSRLIRTRYGAFELGGMPLGAVDVVPRDELFKFRRQMG